MLLGICGKMGSGKDTFKDFLVARLPMDKNVIVKSFASKLKSVCTELFNVDPVRKNERDRKILQQVGESMRKIEPNVWIDYVLNAYKEMYDNNKDFVIISDVRYKNEAQAILNAGGRVVVLEIPDWARKARIQWRDKREISAREWEEANSHSSETGIDDIVNHLSDEEGMFVFEINPERNAHYVGERICKHLNISLS